MGMVSIGPWAIPNEVFAGILAFLTFMVLVTLTAHRVDARLERWCTIALLAGVVTARIVYMALHWAAFSADPLRAFMLWQGGFEWSSGAAAALASIFIVLRSWRGRGVAMAILGASALVWMAAATILDDTPGGLPLPEVMLTDVHGAAVPLRTYASGPVVVNLWATWCPPCRRELPAMAKQAAATPSVPFLFVNQAEDASAVQSFLGQQSLTLDHVLFDADSELARKLRTAGIPMTLFFRDGFMTDIHAGEITPEILRQKTEALIQKK